MAKKKSKPVKKSGLSSSAWVGIFAGLVFAVGIAGGVLGFVLTRSGGNTASAAPKPPDFAYAATAPKGAAEAYQFAIDNPDVLKQIPCYCGCVQDGHKDNLDCFIKSRDGDNVTFDKHGAG